MRGRATRILGVFASRDTAARVIMGSGSSRRSLISVPSISDRLRTQGSVARGFLWQSSILACRAVHASPGLLCIPAREVNKFLYPSEVVEESLEAISFYT